MLKEFKEFIMRGNAVELAVGVVIGSAFTTIVNSIVNGLITPLVAWVIKLLTNSTNPNFTGLNFTPVEGVTLRFGDVVSALITFLITAFVLFLIMKSFNSAKNALEKNKNESKETPENTTDTYLREIRDLLQQKD